MIYHITTRAAWSKAQQEGVYIPADFEADGFIHCSTKEQVVETANRYYAGQSDLLLLAINPEKLTAKVIYENLIGGEELYPHLYGPLPLSAVDAAANFSSAPTGEFVFPEKWIETS